MPSDVQQTSQKQSNVSQRSLMVLARCLRWNRRSYVRAASHHRHTRILCYDEMRCVCARGNFSRECAPANKTLLGARFDIISHEPLAPGLRAASDRQI
jgi:hypothetical protein